MSTGIIRWKTTLEQIRADKPKTIFYGMNTCWWTHRAEDLGRIFSGNKPAPIPCDPRGGVLLQTEDIEGFFTAATLGASHYGRHGIAAFVAAHNDNCIRSLEDPSPWCFVNWNEYNDAIDKME
jgi:hypothetical protein